MFIGTVKNTTSRTRHKIKNARSRQVRKRKKPKGTFKTILQGRTKTARKKHRQKKRHH